MTSEVKKAPRFFVRLRNNIRRRLIAGILVVVPLWLTYVALRYFFRALDGFFAPLLQKWVGFSIPGSGFLLLVLFLYLIGMVTANILGRSLIHFGEAILGRIPFVKNIYQAAKQLIHTISLSGTMGFKRVVLVEYPRRGLRVIAFLTNFIDDQGTGKRSAVVFIPTTPNPTSGVLEMVPEDELIETNLSVEEGIKMVISGGIVAPSNYTSRPPNQKAT